jgi:hypothetical protein
LGVFLIYIASVMIGLLTLVVVCTGSKRTSVEPHEDAVAAASDGAVAIWVATGPRRPAPLVAHAHAPPTRNAPPRRRHAGPTF